VRIINFDFLIDKSFNDAPIIMIIANHLTMHADRYDILFHKDLADIYKNPPASPPKRCINFNSLHPFPAIINQENP